MKSEPIHTYYQNHLTVERQILPDGFIEHMPTKTVSPEELHELKCNADYNPTHVYPNVKHYANERGHDQCYRYISNPIEGEKTYADIQKAMMGQASQEHYYAKQQAYLKAKREFKQAGGQV